MSKSGFGKPRFTLKKALKVLANGALSVNEFAKAMQIESDGVKSGVEKYKDKLAIADGKVKLK